MFTTTTVAPLGDEYDGPAVVERSVSGELVIAYAPDTMAGGTLPRHTTIQHVGSFVLPVGAQVWLRKSPIVILPAVGKEAPVTSLEVRTKQDGPLLLGDVNSPDAARLAAVAHIMVPMQVTGTASRPHTDACIKGTLTTTTFAVQADVPTSITDGETLVARIGGIDYELGLSAWQFDFKGRSTRCSDWDPYGSFQLSVRAHDLAPLVSTLDLGLGPACALGNDPLKEVTVGLSSRGDNELVVGPRYDGPVVYMKRGSEEGFDCFDFSTPGLAALPGSPAPFVEACVPPGTLAEPARGAELWATFPQFGVGVLRQANRGDLIAASIIYTEDAVGSAATSQALGLPVDVRQGCAYAERYWDLPPTQYHLREVAFGAPSPVVVGSQQHGVVSSGATSYDVWVGDNGTITLLAQ